MENKFGEKEIWKGTEFWTNEIKKVGVFEQLRGFNDVLTGNEAPKGYKGGPVLEDIELDGKICDIYHTDGRKGEKSETTGNRIFIHIKGELVQE